MHYLLVAKETTQSRIRPCLQRRNPSRPTNQASTTRARSFNGAQHTEPRYVSGAHAKKPILWGHPKTSAVHPRASEPHHAAILTWDFLLVTTEQRMPLHREAWFASDVLHTVCACRCPRTATSQPHGENLTHAGVKHGSSPLSRASSAAKRGPRCVQPCPALARRVHVCAGHTVRLCDTLLDARARRSTSS